MTNEPLSSWVLIKNILYVPAIFVGLSMQSFGILGVLLIVDVLTGIWRSATVNGGASVTSVKAINGIVSKFLFLLIPLVVAYMGHGLGLDLIGIAQAALGVLIFATGYSIIGNIYTIRTGNSVKEFDAVRLILSWLERYLEKIERPPHK